MSVMEVSRERCIVDCASAALPLTGRWSVDAVDIGVAPFAKWYVAKAQLSRVFVSSVVEFQSHQGNFLREQIAVVSYPHDGRGFGPAHSKQDSTRGHRVIHYTNAIGSRVPLMDLNCLRTGLTFDDVLLVPRRSGIRSRSDVLLKTKLSRTVSIEIPVIAANMDTVCEAEMAIAMARLGAAGAIHRFLSPKAQADMVALVKADGDHVVAGAIGTDRDSLKRSEALVTAGVDVLVLDIAHGHSDHAIDVLSQVKKEFPDTDVIAGNVATRIGAQDLADAGADAIKVGVGPGGVCTTRLVAGVGVPQLTAISDCAGVLGPDGNRVPVIADGGIRTSGDIAKALAAGASSVMIGSLLAGTKESPGDVEQSSHGLVKRVRGMASFEAIEARAAREGREIDVEYFEQRAAEGVEGTVPYRGAVSKLLGSLMAGVRSGMSYSDARTIEEFWDLAEFVRVTPSVIQMNSPHATHH